MPVFGYTIVDADDLQQLEYERDHFKEKAIDFRKALRDQEQETFKAKHALNKLQEKMKESDPMSEVQWTKFRLSHAEATEDGRGGPYEIVNLQTLSFYQCNGFPTAAAAAEKATELAKKAPGVKFAVYGPLRILEADVPVVHQDIKHDLKKAS